MVEEILNLVQRRAGLSAGRRRDPRRLPLHPHGGRRPGIGLISTFFFINACLPL
jgi:hypothetical protein